MISLAVTLFFFWAAWIFADRLFAAVIRRIKAKSLRIPPDPSPFSGMTAEEITRARGLVSASEHANLSY